MKNYRKIDFYKWDAMEGRWRYVASSNAYRTLTEASYYMPRQDAEGKLIYFPRSEHPPSITPANTLNLWRVGYKDSKRWFDPALLIARDNYRKSEKFKQQYKGYC